MKRYDHFFWDSSLVNWVERRALALSSYIWRKRYCSKQAHKVSQTNLEVS